MRLLATIWKSVLRQSPHTGSALFIWKTPRRMPARSLGLFITTIFISAHSLQYQSDPSRHKYQCREWYQQDWRADGSGENSDAERCCRQTYLTPFAAHTSNHPCCQYSAQWDICACLHQIYFPFSFRLRFLTSILRRTNRKACMRMYSTSMHGSIRASRSETEPSP